MDTARLHLNDWQSWLDLATSLSLRAVAAVVIFLAGRWLVGVLVKTLRAGLKRSQTDETLIGFICNVLYGVALALVIVTALTQLGINTTSAAAVIGGAALAIGLSLQNQLSSLAAGIMLIITRPFRKGDTVQAGGVVGTVEEINIINTVMSTGDNHVVTLPNSSVFGSVIVNFTARGTRRIELTLPLAHDVDLPRAKQVLSELLAEEPRVLQTPPAVVQVKDLTPASVDLSVQPWVRTGDYGDTRAALLERIKLRFDAAGICLAKHGGRGYFA